MKKKINKSVEYLKAPYSRILIPDDESGTYTAIILEFPGCIAQGDTPQEAYDHLENAAKEWIEAALNLKQEIPSPSQSISYGGKVLLRLPKSLHRHLALIAEGEGVSLNQFIVSALAEKVGAFTLHDKITKKLEDKMFQVAMNAALNTFMTNYTMMLPPDFKSLKEGEYNAGDKKYIIYPQRSSGGSNTLQ